MMKRPFARISIPVTGIEILNSAMAFFVGWSVLTVSFALRISPIVDMCVHAGEEEKHATFVKRHLQTNAHLHS